MNEEIVEEFNERFATVEEALKYIADSQAKSEFVRKRDAAEIRARQERIELNLERMEQNLERMEQNLDQTQQHLNHITKVLRFNIEEYEFQEDKITAAGKILSGRRNK